jgi:glycosyltransferase involved in cell wall biosynthesis
MTEVIVDVIIPAFNEEKAIQNVLEEIPQNLVREVVVVDNNSKDNTFERAKKAGATVLSEKRQGYGWACLKGIEYLAGKKPNPDIVVFLDGDHSDFPEELPDIIQPILNGKAVLVIGSRALGARERGSMTPQQRFGNWLATRLMRILYGARFTDLGPFRAIRFEHLLSLNMMDKTYGWTVEMQLKAIRQKLAYTEVPVRYRKRIGFSKVSGTLKGSVLAGIRILTLIFKYR